MKNPVMALVIIPSLILFTTTNSFSQGNPPPNPKTLVDTKGDKSFTFLPEVKLGQVADELGTAVGARFGLVLDHKFMIGLGGYGITSPQHVPMGYGGVTLEYLPWSDRKVHISFAGLVGGGAIWAENFFVAEPDIRLNVNVNSWFRIAVGGGYRFIGGARYANSVFDGPQMTLSMGFGR